MSKTQFMPLWVSDFLGDTLDLDASEIGAYMLLLMAQWNRDGNSLPNDPKKLQRVARCGRNWAKVWGNIGRYFETDEDGVFSKRLRLESQNVAAKREVNAHNGALGGKAKALKYKDVHVANATETLQRNPSIPEPEPYPEPIYTHSNECDAKSVGVVNVWKDGVGVLVSLSMSEREARSVIGRWLKTVSQNAVAEAITSAARAKTGDPVPYIEAILRPGETDMDIATRLFDERKAANAS